MLSVAIEDTLLLKEKLHLTHFARVLRIDHLEKTGHINSIGKYLY